MRSLTGLSVRSLRRRPGRFALTGAGAALGVAVLYTVLVISGATQAALDEAVTGSTGDVDVVIEPIGSWDATLPAELVAEVAALDGVERALGVVTIRSSLVVPGEPTAELVVGDQALGSRDGILFVVGADLDELSEVRSLTLADGRLPAAGAPEVVLGLPLAEDFDIAVGDQIALAMPSGRHPVLVTGLLDRRGAGLGFQGAVAYTSLAQARDLLGRDGSVTGVHVVLAPGTDRAAWTEQARQQLSLSVAIVDADSTEDGFRDFIAAITSGLTLMSLIAVFVGGFLVFLTFSIAVAERTSTFGTMRALGAQPAQVRRVVLAEAAGLGLLASLVGVLVGRLLAGVAVGAVGGLLGLRLQPVGFPLAPALVGIGVGVVVSVVAAWLPGRRAAQVGAVAAMREGAAAVEVRGRLWPRLAVLGLGLAMGFSTTVAVRNLATLVVLLGTVLLAPFLLRPVAGLVGGVTQRLSPGTGAVAVQHLVKERSRSAYTLALITVVLGMLIAVAGAHAAMSTTLHEVIERQASGAVQVGAPGAFDPSVGQRIAAVPGTGTVTPVRFGRVDSDDTGGGIVVIDPDTYFEVAGFAWADGDDRSAAAALREGGAILLPNGLATGSGLGRGDVLEDLLTAEGPRSFTVAGTFNDFGGRFGAVVGVADAAAFGADRPHAFFVAATGGVEPDELALSLYRELSPDHAVIIDTAESTKRWAFGQLRGFFGLAYVILVAAAAAGLLGLANTLAVSVLSRTHEIGILRSTGTLRRQVRRMVLTEAVTLAVVAFVLALPLGLVLSLGTRSAFRATVGTDLTLTLPWAFLPWLAGLTLAVAALASFLPARRAGHLDPVAALRFD